MATVWIPPLMRDLTNSQARVSVSGETVREVIAELELRYPGIAKRLCEDGRIRRGLSVVVDGVVCPSGLRQSVSESSEVHFMPAISGG